MTISVKKSFIKDKSGHPRASRLSSLNVDPNELNLLRCENKSLKEALEKVEDSYLKATTQLRIKEENSKFKDDQVQESNKVLEAKIIELEHELSTQHEEMTFTKSANKMLQQKVLTLNSELSETRTRTTKIEVDEIKRASKKEIKAWRKELGEERSKNIKLELKLKANLDKALEEVKPLPVVDSETSFASNPVEEALECSVCAEPIHLYKPEYFNGIEMNPACDECKTPLTLTESEELRDKLETNVEFR